MSQSPLARVAIVNLGCRVNRVESDLIANKLQACGCAICPREEADAIVVNTCAVTGEAQTKTRKAVRSAASLAQAPVVVATGCVANLFADELEAAALGLIVEPRKERVAARVLEALGIGEDYVDDRGILAVSPTPTGRTRPGIKIQDGCDNRCTFCIVWKARGASRSIASARIVDAVHEACARNAREVVLTGINLGCYQAPEGDTLGVGAGLPALLCHLLENTEVERIRLSSIEPPDVTEELLDVMASSSGRVAPFLHICLQSGCDATLRRMGRVYTADEFEKRVQSARRHMPRIALGTDVIVGFPGETEAEFEESIAFCKRMQFARMHVFRYSKRPGTPAARASHQVSPAASATRSARMRSLAHDMRMRQMQAFVGLEEDVLVQEPGAAVSGGLFDVVVDHSCSVGEFVRVRFDRIEGDRLVGVRTTASLA